MSTITSANSVLMLGINKLFNIPIQIQGFSADDAFLIDDIDMAETMMGVDGKLSGGWIPVAKSMEISLQADSASNDFFDAWVAAESISREKYKANGSILLQGTGKLYVLTGGFLKKGSVMPAAKKVLQPRKFTIEFETISSAPV
jgi:hypothetical protein